MKRVVVSILFALLGLATALGGAGLYSGYPEIFGIHFVTTGGWRMSVGLLPAQGSDTTPSVALSLDSVLAAGQAYADEAGQYVLNYYAGAGATASLLRANPELNGHAMLGLETFFAQMDNLGIFGELQLGQRFWFYPLGTSPYLGFRVGLTLH